MDDIHISSWFCLGMFSVTQAALQFLKLEAEEFMPQRRELFWSKENSMLLLRSLVTDYQQSLIKHILPMPWSLMR